MIFVRKEFWVFQMDLSGFMSQLITPPPPFFDDFTIKITNYVDLLFIQRINIMYHFV